MNYSEYRNLQEKFSKKLKRFPTNRERVYNDGVLACKSILKEVYVDRSKQEKINYTEYLYLQERFSKKLKILTKDNRKSYQESYNNAILMCKSILKEICMLNESQIRKFADVFLFAERRSKMKKFERGEFVMTLGIAKRIERDLDFGKFIGRCIERYAMCDWGEMNEEDKKSNDEAVECGDLRIHAAYINPKTNEKIWIITEADRSATTILFPEEY